MPKMKHSSASHRAHLAKLRKQRLRQDPAYRQREKEHDALRHSKQRQTEDFAFTITNSEGTPIMKMKRSPAEVVYEARLRDKLRKQRLRQDPEYRQQERERDTLRKRKQREDPTKRQLERERDNERHRQGRKAERERKNTVSQSVLRRYCLWYY